jgi:hypothetical protein
MASSDAPFSRVIEDMQKSIQRLEIQAGRIIKNIGLHKSAL